MSEGRSTDPKETTPEHTVVCAQAPDKIFLHKYCGDTLEAIDRLCEWVNK